jgi:predicted transposase YbfD/YdcC
LKNSSITEIFKSVPDYRRECALKLHVLADILLLSLCAVVSGAESDEEIATYGEQKAEFLRTFLSLPNGIPSHDTITRVFRYLDKDKFTQCLVQHSGQLLDFLQEQHISIDGKVLRATAKRGQKKSGICIITAWACEQQLVLGQLKTAAKSNEKTAIPALLADLDITEAIVSIDAIATNPQLAAQIINSGGNYILALKKNQKNAFEQVADFMKARMNTLDKDTSLDFGSGRIETRTCYVGNKLDLLEELQAWRGIESVIMVHAKREFDTNIEEEYRFYISSKKETPTYFNKRIRAHWGIENHLHWHLDVSFDEDKSKTRMGNGAENHHTLRKLALQMMQQMTDKHSMKERRKKAGWNNDYLLQILAAGFPKCV